MDNKPIIWNNSNLYNQKNHFLLASPSCRCLIIGTSSCGKTNLLLRMLLKKNWLDYNDLYIFSKSLHQPEYKLLKSCFMNGYSKSDTLKTIQCQEGDVDNVINDLALKGEPNINVNYFEDSDSIPDPKDVDSKNNNLFIFDDIMTDKNQSKAEDYYTRGRHNNISCFYISQNYFKLPRQTIRSNANVLILFSLPKKDLQHIYEDNCCNDMEWKEFYEYCNNAWTKPYSYIIINKELQPGEGKYQVNLNQIYIPKKFYSY